MPRRALIACSWNRSAVSWQFRELTRELERRGWEAHFLDDRRQVPPGTEGIEHLHRWPGSGRPDGAAAVRFAHQLVGELRPTLTVSNFVAVAPVGVAAWARRVPTRVCWYHTSTDAIDLDRSATSVAARLRVGACRMRKRGVYRLHTDVVAVSQAAAADHRAAFGSGGPAVTVQHNGVVDSGEVRGPAAVDGPVVAVGRLDPSKGHRTLVEAMGRCADPRPIVLCGEGPEREPLARLARTCGVDLRLLGETANAEVRRLMSTAALVAVPSGAETFGLTVVEGLAAGAPVVATDAGGPAEILSDGVDGVLVPVGDPEALARALERVLDPATNREMSRAARRTFEERFELERRIVGIADWLERRCEHDFGHPGRHP